MQRIIRIKSAAIIACASAVGRDEGKGPLGKCFDFCDETDSFGAKTWEKAESAMQKKAFELVMEKSGFGVESIGAVFAGDLQNQCVSSSYGLLDFDVPYFGLYGACSTAAEGLMLCAMTASAGHFETCSAVTSSHFLAAERQYRSPIEYGAQRSPTAQWTVTGAAAFLVGTHGKVKITEVMPGIVIEKGINDASNMGAAMAPAAADTIYSYFKESGLSPSDFDVIATGDLGFEGSDILRRLAAAEGVDLSQNYNDCGMMIFDREHQDVHSGGSGCGCSASVLACEIIPKMLDRVYRDVLFIGTGAMMSPSSINQGFSIPAVAHLVRFCRE